MPSLDLNPEIVRFIIDKVHEFHSREDVTFPEEDEAEAVNEDLLEQFTADYASDPYYQELAAAIDNLEPEQQMTVVALMWVGRGDYSLDEWEDVLQAARDGWTDHTADYLVGTPLLADYLAEGLAQIETADDD